MTQQKKRRTQNERSASSTEALLDAATRLFAEVGSQASFVAIGQEAGFSHGLVLARFGSKDGLILEVSRRILRHFLDEVDEAASGASGLEAIGAIVDVFFRRLESDQDEDRAFMMLLGEAQGADTSMRQIFAKSEEGFRALIEARIVEAGERGALIEGVEPAAMAAVILGMLRGISLQTRLGKAGFDLTAAKEQIMLALNRLRVG